MLYPLEELWCHCFVCQMEFVVVDHNQLSIEELQTIISKCISLQAENMI